ncbi:unnamed protein product, partial [Pylaiella littoralis]
WGYFLCTFSCGIIAGLAPLWEAEGSVETAAALNSIWPDPRHRPTLLVYDRGCDRRVHLRLHPDPTWAGTINYVDRSVLRLAQDRFHFLNHREAACQEFGSPNKTDNPLLWRHTPPNEPTFRW